MMSDRPTNEKRKVTTSGKQSVGVAGGMENSNVFTGDNPTVNYELNSGPEIRPLHQLRAPVGDFIGREQEIDILINGLRRESRACITGISGMGGIGKTELALLVAERLLDDYPDAQFFINLQGTDTNPRSPQEVMEICIRAFLGPETKLPESPEQLAQIYRSELSGKRVLILLDNAADSAQVRALLPPTGCAVLVTSRQTVALPGVKSLTLHPLTEKEARDLLLEIVPRAKPAAEQICKLCGYLPLALRAAGSLLAITIDQDPVDYATQLKDERNRLELIGTEGVEIDLAASFNLSYERLTSEAARVFRCLSVFPASFDARAEEVVCADEEHVQLSDLVRRSLVLYEESTRRYRLHDLARLFANTKFNGEERWIGEKRFATHYKNVLAAADELYLQGDESLTRGLTLFDLEWGNIQAGHAWVAAQTATTDAEVVSLGMYYPVASVYVVDLRQRSRERIRWLEIGLAAARRLQDREGEAAALSSLGIAYQHLNETESAIQSHEQALLIDRELGDRRGEGVCLGNLGIAYRRRGETRRAIQFFEERLTIARELGDRRGEGNAMGNLGLAYQDLDETHRAVQFYEQQLVIVREIGDRTGEGRALGNLGVAYKNLGENRRAIEFYEQQLLIVREIGDRRGEGNALWNLSLVIDQLNERAQAIQHTEQALIIFEQIEDPNRSIVSARLATLRGNPPRE